MVSIAREIMLQDKVRFAITVISLGFAIVMIVYDLGMFCRHRHPRQPHYGRG
jgi:hypothetical protein